MREHATVQSNQMYTTTPTSVPDFPTVRRWRYAPVCNSMCICEKATYTMYIISNHDRYICMLAITHAVFQKPTVHTVHNKS